MLRTSLAELCKALKERNAACNASMRYKRGLPSDVKETFAPVQHLKSQNVAQHLNCSENRSKLNPFLPAIWHSKQHT